MQILIDADACPVIKIAEKAAMDCKVPVTLLCDTNHMLQSDYSSIKVIGTGADAVDFALITLCREGDIVVTQDYGVAAMALGKGAYGIHPSGMLYTDKNIDQLLMERHLAKKHGGPHPKITSGDRKRGQGKMTVSLNRLFAGFWRPREKMGKFAQSIALSRSTMLCFSRFLKHRSGTKTANSSRTGEHIPKGSSVK